MTNLITFTNAYEASEEFPPVPASSLLPDWYKNLESYRGGLERRPLEVGMNIETNATAKKCMPIFDALTMGYVILTHVDFFVSQKFDSNIQKEIPYFEWPSFDVIKFHPKEQLPIHPQDTGHELSYPKWINPWFIKTPPGYSTLVVSPFHRDTPIHIFPGVVDTDVYNTNINFPFVLKNPKMTGLIPAGTPIAQVIPFKREAWKHNFGGEKEIQEGAKAAVKLKSRFFDSYKSMFRQTKSYK